MATSTLQGLHKAVKGPQATFEVILITEKLNAGSPVRAARAAPRLYRASASLDTAAVRRKGVRDKLHDMLP